MNEYFLNNKRGRLIYEICRLEAIASERPIVPEPYDKRDQAFITQFEEHIQRVCAGEVGTPEEEHDSWWQRYIDMGWVYGPERDPVKKTHPDMIPYDELDPLEREKDEVFIEACKFVARFVK